jgi:hypothetical protein
MIIRPKNMILLHAPVVERTNTPSHRSKPSAKPASLHGLSVDTRPEFPASLFVVHARSLAQAKVIVASRVAGETIIVGPVSPLFSE